ncbi:MAG: hypothetical protein CMF49_06305 [Legionellales bacterium]|nr:hypothetical protein [Legionellales bacterium]
MVIKISLLIMLLSLFLNKAIYAKPIYYSCPSIGYGEVLTYGGVYHKSWRVMYPGTAESVTYVRHKLCSITKQTSNANQALSCYFRFQNNVDGYQQQTGLEGTLTRTLPNYRNCNCVNNRTAKCI